MTNRMRVLILGGYGNFGAQIAQALSGHARIALIIAGRRFDKAQALVAELPGADTVHQAACLDAAGDDLRQRLAALAPDLVIPTCGPFQGQDYGVAQACIELGSHYK
jgi:saccharopine dehydrogenase-like NADP-dependent oxidoreductase